MKGSRSVRGRRDTGACDFPSCIYKKHCKDLCKRHYNQKLKGRDLQPLQPPKRACSVSWCGEEHYAKSFCSYHYVRVRNGADAEATPPAHLILEFCAVSACEAKVYAKGFCAFHYKRDYSGIPLEAERRAASLNGEWGKWYEAESGYVSRKRTLDGKSQTQLQHRYVMEQYLKRPLRKTENVHHINGDRSDNQVENLELWETSQPSGQRIQDKVAFYIEFLESYGCQVDSTNLESIAKGDSNDTK